MKKILTLILDGYGYREETKGNAIWAANPNNFKEAFKSYPHALLEASGTPIGLEANQFGNSEIGHMTIGAGRRIKPPKERVDEYLQSEELDKVITESIIKHKRVHLMGLFSNGKVHSDIEHFKIVYDKLVSQGIKEIYFHLITDGRDTKKDEFLTFYNELLNWTNETGIGKVSTICGRYYAMDRDKKWERTKLYYDLIVNGRGYVANNVPEIINAFYQNNITDEFIKPILVDKNGLINSDDALIWINYRTDRAKQIITTLTDSSFREFNVTYLNNFEVYSFVEIDKKVKTNILNVHDNISNPLGVYLSNLGLSQARVAETEKFAHVTYFFDGEFDGKLDNCNKFLIPSPKVATYDLQPEMSIVGVTKQVIKCMEDDYDFILCNFANPDMVGHTGNFDATVKAIMATDICLGKLIEKAEENFYTIILLADHGNADTMVDEAGNPVTTHTMEKVPFIIMDNKIKLKANGDLTNVAPTILKYMDITIPKEMKDTRNLLVENKN